MVCRTASTGSESAYSITVLVMYGVEGVCVDPEEWEPSWKPGDPARQEGEKVGSWHQTVEEDRHCRMPQDTGDGLVTTPSYVYA